MQCTNPECGCLCRRCTDCGSLLDIHWPLPEHLCPTCLMPVDPTAGIDFATPGGDMGRGGGHWSGTFRPKLAATVTGVNIRSQIVGTHGLVCGVGPGVGPEGRLYCVSAEAQSSRWKKNVPVTPELFEPALEYGPLLYAGEIWTPGVDVVTAHRLEDGEAVGIFPLDSPLASGLFLGPGSGVYAVQERAEACRIICFRPDPDASQTVSITEPNLPVPAVTPTGSLERIIYVTAGGELVALGEDQEAPLWRQQLSVAPSFPVSIAGDRIIVTSTEGYVGAHDLQTGELLWSFDNFDFGVAAAATPAGSAVFVAPEEGSLVELSLEHGQVLARSNQTGSIQGRPSIGTEQVIVGDRDARLSVLDRQRSLETVGGPNILSMAVRGTPVAAGQWIFATLENGSVSIFESE
ncbi:MAG: PQQ-binding-like beta-propeller repeat protein [Armatimonadota bacterium]